MSRISLILVLGVIFTGCSVLRNKTARYVETEKDTLNLINSVRERNITSTDFYIQKAEIEIVHNGNRQKLLANVKYRNPASYLISVRSKSGIEAARIYLTTDSIFVNDRINRKLYYSSTAFIENKYGISADALPLLFGDFVCNSGYEGDRITCIEGKSEIKGYLKNGILLYKIDCDIKKAIFSEFKNEAGTESIVLKFDNFEKIEKYIFPGKIKIEDSKKETTIDISILNIEFRIEGKMDFIPGNNYEKIILR